MDVVIACGLVMVVLVLSVGLSVVLVVPVGKEQRVLMLGTTLPGVVVGVTAPRIPPMDP